MGTHAELLRQRGQYYRLYTQQFKFEKEQAYGVAVPEALPVIK
jgi:ATP-binding cassette subfamily B protein